MAEIPYMMVDTPEEFRRVLDLAWPCPTPCDDDCDATCHEAPPGE